MSAVKVESVAKIQKSDFNQATDVEIEIEAVSSLPPDNSWQPCFADSDIINTVRIDGGNKKICCDAPTRLPDRQILSPALA